MQLDGAKHAPERFVKLRVFHFAFRVLRRNCRHQRGCHLRSLEAWRGTLVGCKRAVVGVSVLHSNGYPRVSQGILGYPSVSHAIGRCVVRGGANTFPEKSHVPLCVRRSVPESRMAAQWASGVSKREGMALYNIKEATGASGSSRL